jgi:hypothetical protein
MIGPNDNILNGVTIKCYSNFMFIGGVGECLFPCWILMLAQMKGTLEMF